MSIPSPMLWPKRTGQAKFCPHQNFASCGFKVLLARGAAMPHLCGFKEITAA